MVRCKVQPYRRNLRRRHPRCRHRNGRAAPRERKPQALSNAPGTHRLPLRYPRPLPWRDDRMILVTTDGEDCGFV